MTEFIPEKRGIVQRVVERVKTERYLFGEMNAQVAADMARFVRVVTSPKTTVAIIGLGLAEVKLLRSGSSHLEQVISPVTSLQPPSRYCPSLLRRKSGEISPKTYKALGKYGSQE